MLQKQVGALVENINKLYKCAFTGRDFAHYFHDEIDMLRVEMNVYLLMEEETYRKDLTNKHGTFSHLRTEIRIQDCI